MSKYSKAIIAVLTAAGEALQAQYVGNPWVNVVTAGIGAFLVYFVPNTPSSPKGVA